MPSRKIPKHDFLEQIIKYIIRKRRIVESQKEFCYLVLKSLKQYDKRFALTPMRVRRLALSIPGIKIKTKTRRTKKKKVLKTCPVCKGKVIKKYEINLLGRRVAVGYRCRKCGFRTDLKSFMPRKYIFIFKK